MALDKFRNSLNKDNLMRDLRQKWNSEAIRVRNEILNNSSIFLKSEGFSVEESPNSVIAKYQEAIISISMSPEIPQLSDSDRYLNDRLKLGMRVKYNKWGDNVRLAVDVPITSFIIHATQIDTDIDALSKYANEFPPFKYSLYACIGNDLSKTGFFGKIFAISQDGSSDKKEFNQIEDLIEAALNEEFTMKGIW